MTTNQELSQMLGLLVVLSSPVDGLVAQLEERRLCKAEALGSNPSKSTNQPKGIKIN